MLFQLAIGTEVVVLLKIGLPSFKVAHYNQGMRDEQMRMKLDLFKEVRETIAVKEARNYRKATQYYNKRVKNRQFQAGKIVLRQIESFENIPKKLDPMGEGPRRVLKAA